MNNSNLSSETPTLVSAVPNRLENYVDFIARSYDCLVHVIYFLFVAFSKGSELRTRTCLFLHNINAATFAISILYVLYIPSRAPVFKSQLANDVLCTLTELAWSCLKYARVLSLLLLALYRYAACLHVPLYKRINARLRNILALILATWLISFIIPTIFKVSLKYQY